MNDEDSEPSADAENDWFSPTGFAVITDYMHLYPLWAAALQYYPVCLAADYNGDRQCEITTNRSNAAIESHFRVTKQGRLGGRRSVRPKQFIDLQLAYVNGKLNEATLPRTSQRRLTTQLADTEEMWGRRRARGSRVINRAATYSSSATAANVLEALSRRSRRGRGRGRDLGRGRGGPADQTSLAASSPASGDVIVTSSTAAAPPSLPRLPSSMSCQLLPGMEQYAYTRFSKLFSLCSEA